MRIFSTVERPFMTKDTPILQLAECLYLTNLAVTVTVCAEADLKLDNGT
jgi:hypothetical protein